MEGAPLGPIITPEIAPSKPEKSKEKESKKSRKRSPESFGVLAVEKKSPEIDPKDRKLERKEALPAEKLIDFKKLETNPAEQANVETASEERAPLDQVGAVEEKPAIQRGVGRERSKVVAQEVAQHANDPVEVAPAVAALEFNTLVAEGRDPDEALRISAENQGIAIDNEPDNPADAAGFIAPETLDQSGPESAEENDKDQTPETERELGEDDEIAFDHTTEAAPDDDVAETEPDDSAGAGAGSGGSSSGGGRGGSSGGGGAGTPPLPPTPPGGFGSPGFPGGPGSVSPAVAGAFYNAAPAAAAPNRQRAGTAQQERLDEGNGAGPVLLAGIVGYLIGRRRGRIKTEKRLLPIQKKLEKQVVDMQWQIHAKEQKLRRVVAEQVRNKPVEVVRIQTESIRERVVERTAALAALEQQPKLSQVAERERERILDRQRAPEAHQLHGELKTHEHIGHMLLAESAPFKRPERQAPESAQAVERRLATAEKVPLQTDKRVETMNRTELMELSEKIVVEGSSLRQIYESHLVGERGLRRLVAEYLRGGDIKRALRREIVEREIDFERDPVMRDVDASGGGTTGGGKANGNSKAVLDQLVARAAANVTGGVSEEAAFYKARAAHEAEQRERQQHQHHVADIAVAIVITILTALIVGLYLMHR
jgi:hypothetical protein